MVTESKIISRVLAITAEVLALGEREIQSDSSIRNDLQADSLDLVTLIWALEEEFGGTIDNSALENLDTPNDIAQYIEWRIVNKAANET